MNDFNFKFDYNQSEHDGEVLKNILLSKINLFNTYEEMESYIKASDGFWEDVFKIVAQQFGK